MNPPMMKMENIVGPKYLWPQDIKGLLFLRHRETSDQIIKLTAFAYLNGVSATLLVKVFRQIGLGTAIHAQYQAWNSNKDLRGAVRAFHVKKNGIYTLNDEARSSLSLSQTLKFWSPKPERKHDEIVLDDNSADAAIQNLPEELWSPEKKKRKSEENEETIPTSKEKNNEVEKTTETSKEKNNEVEQTTETSKERNDEMEEKKKKDGVVEKNSE